MDASGEKFYCSACKRRISTSRFRCTVCTDVNLCTRCYAAQEPQHIPEHLFCMKQIPVVSNDADSDSDSAASSQSYESESDVANDGDGANDDGANNDDVGGGANSSSDEDDEDDEDDEGQGPPPAKKARTAVSVAPEKRKPRISTSDNDDDSEGDDDSDDDDDNDDNADNNDDDASYVGSSEDEDDEDDEGEDGDTNDDADADAAEAESDDRSNASDTSSSSGSSSSASSAFAPPSSRRKRPATSMSKSQDQPNLDPPRSTLDVLSAGARALRVRDQSSQQSATASLPRRLATALLCTAAVLTRWEMPNNLPSPVLPKGTSPELVLALVLAQLAQVEHVIAKQDFARRELPDLSGALNFLMQRQTQGKHDPEETLRGVYGVVEAALKRARPVSRRASKLVKRCTACCRKALSAAATTLETTLIPASIVVPKGPWPPPGGLHYGVLVSLELAVVPKAHRALSAVASGKEAKRSRAAKSSAGNEALLGQLKRWQGMLHKMNAAADDVLEALRSRRKPRVRQSASRLPRRKATTSKSHRETPQVVR